ncbi:MAG: 50S ribosomal protein L2 [Candidatus Aenigmarchaeota archaeon]|nr:50S ribosomal protein L2 [Candidatus Aenigmarchaeota archaeon]
MGKRIRAQRKGSNKRYRSPSHRRIGKPKYLKGKGIVIDIIHNIGKPLMKVRHESGENFLMIAPENVSVGDIVEIGENATMREGNVLPIGRIPEGVPIFNIEKIPGDNGTYIRSSGTFGFIESKGKKCIVRLPSKKTVELNVNCLATVGIVAGGGRTDKPFVKAGIKYKVMRSKGKLYPIVSGVSMNPVDHPFGGKTKPGIPKTVPRNAPPGAKVGSIAARRTGKKR